MDIETKAAQLFQKGLYKEALQVLSFCALRFVLAHVCYYSQVLQNSLLTLYYGSRYISGFWLHCCWFVFQTYTSCINNSVNASRYETKIGLLFNRSACYLKLVRHEALSKGQNKCCSSESWLSLRHSDSGLYMCIFCESYDLIQSLALSLETFACLQKQYQHVVQDCDLSEYLKFGSDIYRIL